MDKVSMSYLLFFSIYQTKYVIKFLFRQLTIDNSSSIILWSNGRQGEKEGRMEIQKLEYLGNEQSFLDEIKSIFQFLKGYHLVKK